MADGYLNFDTKLDTKGMTEGLGKLAGVAKKACKTAAVSIAAAGTALTGLTAKAIQVGASFESSMSQVAATMGITAQEIAQGSKSYEILSEAAKAAGASTKYSATEAADALNYLALAGYDASTAANVLPSVLNLAAASGMDLAAASDLATDAMSALGIAANSENLTAFGDKLAKTASKSNTSVSQLGEAILTCAGTAKGFGMSTEALAANLGVLANRGLKSTEAGTHLRNIILALEAPTDNAAKKLRQLGVSATNSDGSFRDLNDIIADLNKSMSNLTDEQRAQALSEIFNKTDLEAVNYLMAGLGDEYDNLYNEVSNCDGAMQDMADTMNDNLTGQVTILQSSLEGLGIQAYEGLEEPIKDVVKTVIDMVGKLSDAFSANGFTGLVDSLGDVLSDAATYIVSFAPQMVESGMSLLYAFGSGLMRNSSEIISSAAKLVATLVKGILDSLPQIGTAALQLGTELIDSIRNVINSGFGDFITYAIDLVDGLADGLTQNAPIFIQKGCEMLQNLAQGIADSLPTLISRIPEIISKLANVINDNAPTVIKAGFNIVVTLVKGIIEAIPTLISNIPKIITAVVDVWSAFNWVNLGKNAINFIKNGMSSMVGAVQSAGKNILDSATSAIKNLPATFKNLGQMGVKGLGEALKGMAGTAKQAAYKTVLQLKNTMLELPASMKEIGTNIIKGLWNGMSNMVGWMTKKVKEFASNVLGGIKKAFGINSPSKITKGYGEYLAQGLAIGFDDYAPKTLSSMVSDIDDMMKEIKAATTAENLEITTETKARVNISVGESENMAKKAAAMTATVTNDIINKMRAAISLERELMQSRICANSYNNSVANNYNNNITNTYNQKLEFNQPIQTPSQVARAARKALEVH